MKDKEKYFHFIYKTTCLVNGMFYIGHHSTNNVHDRYLGSGKALKLAIKEYGKENFVREEIEFCKFEELAEKEKQYIIDLNATNGYNILITGGGGMNLGVPHTDEVKQLLSKLNKGENNNQFGMTGEKSTWWGRKHTEEEKKKIGDAQRGELNHMYGKNGELNPMWGKVHTEETREKISQALKGVGLGRKLSEETKIKMSEARLGEKNCNYGKKLSDETKLKMSIARKGKKHTIVTCPYCNRSGGKNTFTRWHFENCKQYKTGI